MLYHVTGMSLLAEISGDLWLTRRDRDARSSVTKKKKNSSSITLSPSVPDTISDKRGQVRQVLTTRASDTDQIVRSFPFISNEKKILFQFIDFQCRFLIYRWSIPYFNFLIFFNRKNDIWNVLLFQKCSIKHHEVRIINSDFRSLQ